ncbi:aminoglycoside phosphotransferase family protein [Isoptericola sp. NEAU-Y5]|uniref:Aminoglycoside phosphotransferase family protein n=1 Tax=Isoptericola luteus TaxID=2879484 RepID=A0ABS7ZFX9_9MICO|nr:aminoglycoside phosphotransferase family protein [Isoptericola sp. NEAU-Y5]MCA5893926.1 aminoglycoside phosphotransferase family protein [Isoptericola sp. NEAU-Y5]
MTRVPAAEIDVDVPLARALLAEQHPDLLDAGEPRVVAHGWDNVMLRVGDELALRLPRRAAAAELVLHEQQALPLLAGRLRAAAPDVAVPALVRAGRPSAALGYPWSWTVVPWVDGVGADRTPVAARTAWAGTFGRFLAALHVPAPPDAPANRVRGVPLARRAEARDPAALAARLDLVPPGRREAARSVWRSALAAPEFDGPPVWLHGDPHPANLVVPGGGGGLRLAVVDWGDVTSGDPAGDLGAAWLCFDAAGLARFRNAVQAHAAHGRGWDEATWVRARAWALLYATNMLAHPGEHPRMVPIGEHGLAHLLA